ncbi:hypothetical protein CHUAL_007922 [Chamberlinius hualienensis]
MKLIEKINSYQKSWTAGPYEEFEKMTMYDMYMMSGGPKSRIYNRPSPAPVTKDVAMRTSSLPENFDWTDHNGQNFVTPVRYQGFCGSCYAFAATAMVEARFKVSTNNSVNYIFSPEDVLECSNYSQGCEGGLPYLIGGKYAMDFGFVEESCNSYTGFSGICYTNQSCPKYYTSSYQYVGGYDGACNEELMREAIFNGGPIACSFLTYDDFSNYKHGIYHHVALTEVERIEIGFNPFEESDHSVLCVGWGADPTTGEKFWRVKNSWGAGWGEDGYFRIRRGTDECAIENKPRSMDEFLEDSTKMEWEEMCKFEKKSLERNSMLLRKLEEFQLINTEMALKIKLLKEEREKLITERKFTRKSVMNPNLSQLPSTFTTGTALFKKLTNLNEFWEKVDKLHLLKSDEKVNRNENIIGVVSRRINNKTVNDSTLFTSKLTISPVADINIKSEIPTKSQIGENTLNYVDNKREIGYINTVDTFVNDNEAVPGSSNETDSATEEETKAQKLEKQETNKNLPSLPKPEIRIHIESEMENAISETAEEKSKLDVESASETEFSQNQSPTIKENQLLLDDITKHEMDSDSDVLLIGNNSNETVVNNLPSNQLLINHPSLEKIDVNSTKENVNIEQQLVEDIKTIERDSQQKISKSGDNGRQINFSSEIILSSSNIIQQKEINDEKFEKVKEINDAKVDESKPTTSLNNLQPIINLDKEEIINEMNDDSDHTEDFLSSMALNTRLNQHPSGNLFGDGETTEGQSQMVVSTEKTNQLVNKLANYLGHNSKAIGKKLPEALEEKKITDEADDDFDFFD